MYPNPKFEVRGAKQDDKLKDILALVRQAVETLIDALQKTDYGLKFKAFTLKKFEGEHAEAQMNSLTDTIGAGIIMGIQDIDRSLADKWDLDMCNIEDEEHVEVWIHAKRKEDSELSVEEVEDV